MGIDSSIDNEDFTLTWDLNGNLDTKNNVDTTDDKAFVYNFDNKLRNATYGADANTIDIIYDPAGNRICKKHVDKSQTPNVTKERKYIVDTVGSLPTILCEIESSSLTRSYVYANARPLAMHDGDYTAATVNRYFYLHDRLGSVRMVIDQAAVTQNTYTYNPFGEDISSECTESVLNP